MTQHPGTKNHTASHDKKKSCNLSGQKKIMRPHGTKITQSLGTKKITQPLGTKKIIQPLGTKRKSHNLLGHNKSNTTSWGKT